MVGLWSAPGVFLAAITYSTLFSGVRDIALVLLCFLVRHGHQLGPLRSVASDVGQAGLAAFLVLQLCRYLFTRTTSPRWTGPGKVLLIPSRTTHARMFPEKHSFSYSYLVVGIPVGWEGNAGGLVSVGVQGSSGLSSWFSLRRRVRKGWYSVDAADYLERGNGQLGLRGKLDAYLESQGANPADFPQAYLVTAARFLGYHFNPVSFWYLYDANKTLAAMILEVNNTFGERRMYFLSPDDGDLLLKNGSSEMPERTMFKQKWPKDFHVSPFNSRKGAYTLAAHDPLSPRMQGTGPFSNTINLVSSQGRGKLVARLIPDGTVHDPEHMTTYQKARFLASWWWVGFVTFPRIVKEAGLLFFRRKLHVWFRPEPLKESLGRCANKTEVQLEAVFRRYLRFLVEQSTAPLAVKYIPSGLAEDRRELMLSPSAKDGTDPIQELDFKVLTPAFYARFVYYAHDAEALFCECQESNTLSVSRPDLLPRLVLKKPAPPLTLSWYGDYAYFKLIQRLRARPERIERPLTSSAVPAPQPTAVDIRDFRLSSMDGYVLAHEGPSTRRQYRANVLTLFLADRIALGSVALLQAQQFVVQLWLAWVLSYTLDGLLAHALERGLGYIAVSR